MPFDVGKMLFDGGRQGREMCPCACSQPMGQQGGRRSAAVSGILPQHQLPQPSQQAPPARPLLEQHPALIQHQRHTVTGVMPGARGRFLGAGGTVPAGQARQN